MDNYIPFLKLKSNEIFAIKELDSECREKVIPFFDYAKREKDTAENIEKQVGKLSKSFARHISFLQEFYIDNYDFSGQYIINGSDSYEYILEKLNFPGLIPVIGIDRAASHNQSVLRLKKIGELASETLAFRISYSDFNELGDYLDEIQDLLADFLLEFIAIDLILDFRVCTKANTANALISVGVFLREFYKLFPVRRLVIAGSSISSVSGENVSTESEKDIERKELEIFHGVVHELGFSECYLGDYGVVSPDYSDPVPGKLMPSVSTPRMIYSYSNSYFLIRGGAFKTHKDSYGQYFDLCKEIVSKDFYRGEPFSTGDKVIYEKSKGAGKNLMPSSVVKPLVNAHITYMLKNY